MARSFLDVLDLPVRRELESLAWRRTFDRREVIFHAGDPGDSVHHVRRGRVGIRVETERGEDVIVRLVPSGGVFGELAVIGPPEPRSATAVAMEPVETWSLHRRDVDRLRAAHPSVDRFFVELLAARLRSTSQQLVEALYVPAEPRVRRRVTELVAEYLDGSGPVEVPLTQTEVAALAGTSRATVNKVLREGEAQGLVELRRGGFVVPDPDAILGHRRRRNGR